MEANMLQKLNETKDMSDQKVRELEGSLGLALQSIREIKTKLQAEKVEVKRAPVVLMVDNLTKAKRALTVTKQLCPTGINVQKLKQKTQVQQGLKARTSLVYSHLLPCTGLYGGNRSSQRCEICNLWID